MKNTEKGLSKKEAILLKAKELLGSEGGRSFSMRALADACEVRLSHVQYYFKTPESLYFCLLERMLIEANEEFQQALKRGEEPIKELVRLVFSHLDNEETCQLFWEMWARAGQHDENNQMIIGFYQNYLGIIRSVVLLKNKNLSEKEAHEKAVVILALLEGAGVVYGKGRKAHLASNIEEIFLKNILLIINGKESGEN